MNRFLTSILTILGDQRGAIGDDDDSADDTSDKTGDKEDQDKDKDLDEDDELFIDLDEKDEDEDEEAEKKAEKDKDKDSEEVTKLRSEIDTLKEKEKEWKRDMYQARKDREEKKLEIGKDEKPLSDGQLAKLLEDADTEGDGQVKLNVLKYLAQRIAKGEVKEAVNAAEMSRKAGDLKKKLEDRFPDIATPTSDMRLDLDKVKEELNITDHPYGDMFAVGFKLFEDMDQLIEASFEAGKEEALKGTADEKRKKEIKDKSLPPSKRSVYKKTHGLSASQLETAQQMNLTQDQLPAYAKLVGKKPRTVSVEG